MGNSKALSIPFYPSKLTALVFLSIILLVFTIFYFQAIHSSPSAVAFLQWKKAMNKTSTFNYPKQLEDMTMKLRDSVTFLPLKDQRFSDRPMEGHTWFMSSLNDTKEEEEVEYLYFPSAETSKGRLLCIDGRDKSNGERNSYALAWPNGLPADATLVKGLTFVSETFYDYENLWHGLSSMVPFVGWYKRKGCEKPARWLLFHKGELRTRMGGWVENLMKATFDEEKIKVEDFEGKIGPYCFEKAVVMRHNEGKMGKRKRLQVYDFLRCKARRFCNVVEEEDTAIRLTLLMRKETRSFKNQSAVVEIFKRECERVEGCKLVVAQSKNLSFCDQVRLMSSTDIVASPHGAQLTNLVFMERNSSVMEFFPRGWLELAGAGQYVFHWLSSWCGMRHEGGWWDTNGGDPCPPPKDDHRCFFFYKNGLIGHNETYFVKWARNVLTKVKMRKLEEEASKKSSSHVKLQQHLNSNACTCN